MSIFKALLRLKSNKLEEIFVHREATSQYHTGVEEIKPNPDKKKTHTFERSSKNSPILS